MIQARHPTQHGIWLLLTLAAPSLAVYSIGHLGLWPAQMTPDSMNQWLVGIGVREPRDVLSWFHAALIHLITRAWLSPAAVIVAHIIALSVATALILRELLAWGVHRSLIVAMAILFPLWPANIFLVTTIWTDVAYAIGLLFSVFLILRMLRTDVRWPWFVAFCAVLIFIGLIRHNGLISAALIGLGASLYFFSKARRLAAIAIAAWAVLVPIALKAAVYPQIGVLRAAPYLAGIVPIHIISYYVTNGYPLQENDRKLMDKAVSPDAVRSRYTCEDERLVFTSATDREFVNENISEIFALAFRLIASSPRTYLGYLACTSEILWKPATFRSPIPVIGLPTLAIEPLGPSGEQTGLVFDPVSQHVHAILKAEFDWTSDFDRRWLFWRPAWPLYLTLLVSAIVAWRQRRVAMVLLAAPSVATTLSFLLFIHVPAYRYQWGVVMVALLIWPMVLVSRHRPAPQN